MTEPDPDADDYRFNYPAALEFMPRAENLSTAAGGECQQAAQVHAALAVADAIERLTDSYNGWKAHGS